LAFFLRKRTIKWSGSTVASQSSQRSFNGAKHRAKKWQKVEYKEQTKQESRLFFTKYTSLSERRLRYIVTRNNDKLVI